MINWKKGTTLPKLKISNISTECSDDILIKSKTNKNLYIGRFEKFLLTGDMYYIVYLNDKDTIYYLKLLIDEVKRWVEIPRHK
jgi:hypothetical protein